MPWRTKLLPRRPKTIRRFHVTGTEKLPSTEYPIDFKTTDEYIGPSNLKQFKK